MKLVTRETLAKQLFWKLKMNIYLSVLPCWSRNVKGDELPWKLNDDGGDEVLEIFRRRCANYCNRFYRRPRSVGHWLAGRISFLRVGVNWYRNVHCSCYWCRLLYFLSHELRSRAQRGLAFCCLVLVGWSWIIAWICCFIDKYTFCRVDLLVCCWPVRAWSTVELRYTLMPACKSRQSCWRYIVKTLLVRVEMIIDDTSRWTLTVWCEWLQEQIYRGLDYRHLEDT